jgi:hypothetical protein
MAYKYQRFFGHLGIRCSNLVILATDYAKIIARYLKLSTSCPTGWIGLILNLLRSLSFWLFMSLSAAIAKLDFTTGKS